MKIRTPAWSCVAAAMLLAGCASSVDLKEGAPVESRSGTPVTASGSGSPSGSGTAPVSSGATSRVATVDAATAALAAANAAGRVIYFDFDSFVLRDEFKPIVDAHARALVANRGRKLMIEGHADERGGREYNLALGQKRAETVVRSLVLLGSSEDQLEAVSYGKERPAVEGHTEEAWARNRRAELKDRTR